MARVPKKLEVGKSLLDNLNEALVILDPALEVVEWNAAMERLTGVRAADAVGRSAAALLPLFRDTTLVPLIRRALAGETPDAAELPHTVAGDERVAWLKARCVPWHDGDGGVTGAITFFSDISDQQRHALLLLAMEAIGQSLTSSLNLNEVLDTIVNKALEVMGAESAMVVLGDANAPEFRVMRAAGRLSAQYTRIGTIPIGGGPISVAVRDGRTVTTRNILTDTRLWLAPTRRSDIEREGFKATAAAPLAVKDRILGALVVHYWTERTFGSDETAALEFLAKQAGIAIRNASLYEAEHAEATRIRALTNVNRRISSALELDALLRTISDSAAELTGAKLVTFWLADEQRRTLSFTSSTAPEMMESYSPTIMTYDQGATGWVARNHEPLVVDDMLADERLVNRAWSEQWGMRSYAGYPVLAGNELLAVMALAHTEPLRFGKDKLDLLELFLAQAAIAIQNARLFREAKQRRDVAEVLARLARELTSTLEVEPIAKLLARGAAELVNARAAGVFLIEPEDGSLRATAAYGADADIMRELIFKSGEGAVGRAIVDRRIVTSADILSDPAIQLAAWVRERIRTSGYRVVVGVPLLTHDRVIGALGLGADPGSTFTREELQTLEALADQAALAFENARLYASARDSLVRLGEKQVQLVQAAKMSALGQLVSGVAHELNNPLSVIVGYGQLLLAREVPGAVLRPIELMVSQADRMAKIVRNLLLFARQRPAERTTVNMNEVLEQTLALRINQLTVSGIAVEKKFARGLPPVLADPHQLEQVFLNLLLNAEQAMLEGKAGGRIILSTTVSRDGRMVHAEVIDDGPGIPQDALPHVFEPFFSTKPVGSGTGLGLSVSYGIVEEHGGHLVVESRPGRTVFRLEVPVAQSPAAQRAKPAGSPMIVTGEGRIALVVEDEASVLDLIVTILSQTGWRVDVATGGREGLERVRNQRYDLIVSDIRMPDGDGESFYKEATQDDPALGQRFIFITGDTANRDAFAFLKDAGVLILEKPFQPTFFLDAVRRVTS
ncbi:MAG TPA: GAF domain-containing protein [Methylomirabilota bacterium]|nr:GAF domain-containing protein [Methylomirabilota bacterium]